MAYTPQMRNAFHSVLPPKNFSLQIIDNENFLTVKASEDQFMKLPGEDRKIAVEYMIRVKKALEGSGAIVLLVREGGKEL